ncbi:MAG: MBL fold metallo-hydrolase [Verrucomicrobiae bacterium]|nr:MBL fold metallo-hydrolase [Verrucomicrobiae bacterium]
MKVKIYLLGTASGIPTWNRYCESVAIAIDGGIYMMDAGEPCSASLVRKGVDLNSIRAVFISHLDPDHCSGLPMLIQTLELSQKRTAPLTVYIPGNESSKVRDYLRMMYLPQEALCFKVDFLDISPKTLLKDGTASVTAHSTGHVAGRLKYWAEKKGIRGDFSRESFSFKLTAAGKNILYTGDVREMSDLDGCIDGVDVLLGELAHMEPRKFFDYLKDKKIPQVICLHIHPAWNDREAEIAAMGEQILGRKITVGVDGMELDFDL